MNDHSILENQETFVEKDRCFPPCGVNLTDDCQITKVMGQPFCHNLDHVLCGYLKGCSCTLLQQEWQEKPSGLRGRHNPGPPYSLWGAVIAINHLVFLMRGKIDSSFTFYNLPQVHYQCFLFPWHTPISHRSQKQQRLEMDSKQMLRPHNRLHVQLMWTPCTKYVNLWKYT